MISHEIRSPIGSAIFQSDSIIDDIDSWEYDKEHIKEELNVLSEQLIKTGEILTKLFSVEYYDVHSVSLFRESIDIYSLIDEEIKIAKKANPKIHFINGIDKNIGFASVDKIQFRQVLTNLLSNAIKFATNKKPTILVEGFKKDAVLQISIEDNGPWFDWIDTENIFDKYTIWKGDRVWLWMWLYLCKRIVEMHSGEIQAKPWSHLWWARFDIIIPIL
jgi:K+-sensing histidine kinase KdpD